MNDMNETTSFPSEADIHAYIDGHLDPAGSARMEAWLDRHPERAEEIRRWQSDAQQLRAAMGGLPVAPARPTLDPAAIRRRRRHRLRARMAMAAMLVLALGAGGIGGWQARNWVTPTAAPMADAFEAYRMFAMNRQVSFDVTQSHAGQLQAWLDQHFRNAPRLPNLDHAGFRPVGGRLLATESGPAAMVLYEDRQGDAISFYIRPPSSRRGPLPHGQRREGRLATAYWSGNGYNYALVSRADTPDVRIIHRASLSSKARS